MWLFYIFFCFRCFSVLNYLKHGDYIIFIIQGKFFNEVQ